MAKPKTVAECIHHWAHQVEHKSHIQAQCGNVWYDGPVLYSYREPIARFLENNIVLISNTYFSNTTRQHQSKARQSVPPSWQEVYAPHIGWSGPPHEENRRIWTEQAKRRLSDFKLHPRRKSLLREFEAIRQSYVQYSHALALDWPDLIPDSLRAEIEVEQAARLKREEERRIEQAARAAREAEEEREDLVRWRAGEDVRRHFHATALRLVGNEIETTRGARVPVEVAPRLWTAANSCREWSRSWMPSVPFKVGHYTLNSIDNEGSLHIGCHDIHFSELELIAELLGLEKPNGLGQPLPTAQENHHEHARA